MLLEHIIYYISISSLVYFAISVEFQCEKTKKKSEVGLWQWVRAGKSVHIPGNTPHLHQAKRQRTKRNQPNVFEYTLHIIYATIDTHMASLTS